MLIYKIINIQLFFINQYSNIIKVPFNITLSNNVDFYFFFFLILIICYLFVVFIIFNFLLLN